MAVPKGYKQTDEHINKRKRFGPDNCNWIGSAATIKSGRSRALRAYPCKEPCELCGSDKSERHHIDGNTKNNSRENIQFLCRRCHMKEDGRLASFTKSAAGRMPRLIEMAAKARLSRKNCRRGHELSGDNLYVNPKGARVCKSCRSIHKKKYMEKKNGCV